MKLSFLTLFLHSTLLLSIGVLSVYTQSNDQNFPTPITSNEINGLIKARDIGDGRLTRYFYAFDGAQGDIFINVVTKNFAGDIDVFTAESLRPLTKMVIYPDSTVVETGRLIYMRRSERLILRIEGRSPNDDPATFRIKFGGSFVALAAEKGVEAPTIKDAGENETGIRVNSVGTIIEVIPKAKPPIAAVETKPSRTVSVAKETPAGTQAIGQKSDPKTPVVVVTEAPEVKTVFGGRNPISGKSVETVAKPAEPKAKTTTTRTAKTNTSARPTKPTKPTDPPAEKKPDPLASIRLIVQLKTGETIERPMNEVLKFSVDKGVLTVIQKDGKISKYSIFDVAKVTIE